MVEYGDVTRGVVEYGDCTRTVPYGEYAGTETGDGAGRDPYDGVLNEVVGVEYDPYEDEEDWSGSRVPERPV